MSWRASPSRPAPPVTSTSNTNNLDSLFGPSLSVRSPPSSAGPTGGSRARSISHSASAYSLLAKKMQEIEQDKDDRASVRSGRSGITLGGGASGSGGTSVTARRLRGGARSRTDSSASSAMTARGGWNGSRSSSISEAGSVADEPMQVDEDAPAGDTKGKGKATEEGSSQGRPSDADKRQKLDGPPRSRSTSTTRPGASRNASFSSEDPAATSSSPTTSDPSSSTPPGSRPTLQPAPSPSVAKPPSLLPPSAASARAPSASTTPSSYLSTSSAHNLASPRRWFSRSSGLSTIEPNGNPPASAEDADPNPGALSDPPVPAPALVPDESSALQSEPVCESGAGNQDEVSLELAAVAETTPFNSFGAAAGRGWLSLLTRTRGSSTDLAGDVKNAEEERMDVDQPQQGPDGGAVQEEDQRTPMASPTAERRDATLLEPSSEQPYASDTLTPHGIRRSASSWWGWIRSADGEAHSTAEPPSASTSTDVSLPNPALNDPPPVARTSSGEQAVAQQAADFEAAEAEAVEVAAEPATIESRSWLRTLWGESPEELAERRRREARALKLAMRTSPLAIEATKPSEGSSQAQQQADSHLTPATSATSGSGFAASPEPARPLKHKSSSSWAIFSRTVPAATHNPPADPSVSPQKSGISLRAPLGSFGVASSSASTRSRTSSHRTDLNSLPPSPQLRPQPDGPIKPLTGSIRSSHPPRQGQKFPPVPEPDAPFENLVLPTFNDSFLRIPRSFPLKQSTLTKAVSVVSAYLFSHPPPTSPTLPREEGTGMGLSAPTEMKDDPAERLPKSLEVVGEGSMLDRVKRIVTIGVHGWFPNPRLKSVMGEPTGTSVKFATMMHDAVQSYLESHDVTSFNIQAIALEGQGQVEDRVNRLYNRLVEREEWVAALKKADVVFLATHSQGSVVSTQLLARMLDQGLIVGTQTHLLAMCGIAQGPFVYLYQSVALAPYFNYLESAPARELFEFQNPESVVAMKFLESLRLILNAGIKMTVVGSINDQVVPLYSSLFSGVSHPSILRAVYIDSDAFRTSDFLANLVVFSARLRNAGLSDHDLVYHVSEALAGALTGVGHSKIYEEEEVFNLAVRYHFETTSLTEAPTHLDIKAHAPPLSMSFNPRDRRNPYLLTWALRGIIEDPQVRELFANELKALGEAYETWRPQTKVLKDVKLKLEGIRMLVRKGGKL
ncbi:hypothetical protein JCM1841_002700 [Sporobolomyces salmonicolor]